MGTIVYWHPYRGICFFDKKDCTLPVCGPNDSGWVLLQQIQAMPRKRPVSVQEGWRMMIQEVHRQVDLGNNEPDIQGHSNWLFANTVLWLSQQGYHVELTGDEFEIMESELEPEAAAA